MVKTTVPFDYSIQELRVKKLLKEAHNLLLTRDYAEAADKADEAIVELRLYRTAIRNNIDG